MFSSGLSESPIPAVSTSKKSTASSIEGDLDSLLLLEPKGTHGARKLKCDHCLVFKSKIVEIEILDFSCETFRSFLFYVRYFALVPFLSSS